MQEYAVYARSASLQTRSSQGGFRTHAAERAFSPSLDGEFARRHQAGDAEGNRRAERRRAVRADPVEPSPEAPFASAAPTELRSRAEAPSGRSSGQERELRRKPEFPRRRLLA